MNVQEYIESGILEAYVLGSASEAETRELLYLKGRYPQIQQALTELEQDMESMAERMAVPPPPMLWNRIEDEIEELVKRPQTGPVQFRHGNNGHGNGHAGADGHNQFIEVEAQNSYMRVHKAWKWILITIFVLGKIFLGFAIYFYLENRQAQQQIQELKSEMKEIRAR